MKRLFIFGVLFIFCGAIYVAWWPGNRTPQQFGILKGSSAAGIARELKASGLIGSPRLFRVWVRFLGSPNDLQPGVYHLLPGYTGYRIYRQIRRGPPLVRVTFPEGWTARQMAELLESRGITTQADFMNVVERDKREGFLFPDTYFFNQALSADVVVKRLVQRFDEQAPSDLAAQAKVMKLTPRELVTVASLVEKEARVPEERPVIAGVFYNRLRKRWRLESCATVQYALGNWKARLTYKDLEINHPYNTYRHFGLPPGPICNPGKASLEAASHPAKTDVLFFVAEGNGTHRFSKYYKEHLNAKKQTQHKL
jgi:UPF0755 protein